MHGGLHINNTRTYRKTRRERKYFKIILICASAWYIKSTKMFASHLRSMIAFYLTVQRSYVLNTAYIVPIITALHGYINYIIYTNIYLFVHSRRSSVFDILFFYTVNTMFWRTRGIVWCNLFPIRRCTFHQYYTRARRTQVLLLPPKIAICHICVPRSDYYNARAYRRGTAHAP